MSSVNYPMPHDETEGGWSDTSHELELPHSGSDVIPRPLKRYDKSPSILSRVLRSLKRLLLSYAFWIWAVMVFLVLFLAIGTALPYIIFEQSSINTLTGSVSRKVSNHVVDTVSELFWNPVKVVDTLGSQFDIGLVNREDATSMSRSIYAAHKNSWMYGDLFVALDTNQLVGHSSKSDHEGLQYLRWDPEEDKQRIRIFKRTNNWNGDATEPVKEISYPGKKYDWDITQLPWHKSAKLVKSTFWYGPYIGTNDDGEQAVFLSIVRPIFNPEDQTTINGVVYLDFNIQFAQSFLLSIEAGDNGRIFITDKQGSLMLQNSNKESMWAKDEDSGELVLKKAWESGDDLIRAAGEYMKGHEVLEEDEYRHSASIFRNGNWLSVEFVQFNEVGINWWVATIVPRSDYSSVVVGYSVSIAITVMLAILVIVIGTSVIVTLNQAVNSYRRKMREKRGVQLRDNSSENLAAANSRFEF